MEVMLKRRAEKHVKEFYPDVKTLIHDRNAVGARGMVLAGCFLCYYSDIREWWESIGGTPIRNDEALWNKYITVIAAAVERIIFAYEHR